MMVGTTTEGCDIGACFACPLRSPSKCSSTRAFGDAIEGAAPLPESAELISRTLSRNFVSSSSPSRAERWVSPVLTLVTPP